jgi:hypothetical protein
MHRGLLLYWRGPALTVVKTWAVGAVVATLGLVFVVGPSIVRGRIPGDLGDARFISYILEHFFRWITGQEASFWSANFFYPFPLTIAFGDNFLGDDSIYAAFRLMGFVREDAFRLWYITGFVINFAVAAYALVRLGFSRLPAALGAFLFTFGLPITAQEGHAQLLYRFGVPLAVLAFENFRVRKNLPNLILVAIWTTWQFYCSIYIGYFLSLLLISLACGHAICHPRGPISAVQAWTGQVPRLWSRSTPSAKIASLLILLLLAACMVLLWMPYLEVSHLYGFRRQWSEVASMLPRPASYLLSNNSLLWPTGRLFDALPMRHEHAMFIGIAPLLTIVIAVALRILGRARLDSLFAPIALAVLLLMLLTLWIHGFSAYRILTWLPGLNAVRGVTRIITVLLFPCGAMFAASLDAIIGARLPSWPRAVTVALLTMLAVFESSYIVHYVTTKRAWQERLAAVAAELPPKVPPAPILLLAPQPGDPAPWGREIDAMLLAQDHNWRTLNGYSGNTPPRPELAGGCQDAAVSLVSGLTFLGRNSEQTYAALARDVLMIGYPPCDEAELLRQPGVTMLAGPLPAQLMTNISLRIDSLKLHDSRLVVAATIINRSSLTLPAYSTTHTPVRLSPRFVDNQTALSDLAHLAGWDLRQPVGFNVPGGSSRSITFSIAPPPVPGTYRLAISMVQDGVAWFHNLGMRIPISVQTVDVAADHTVRLSGDGD